MTRAGLVLAVALLAGCADYGDGGGMMFVLIWIAIWASPLGTPWGDKAPIQGTIMQEWTFPYKTDKDMQQAYNACWEAKRALEKATIQGDQSSRYLYLCKSREVSP